MATRIEAIYDMILPEMEAHKIPDTPENRLALLEALKDDWVNETVYSPKLAYYILAIHMEIARLNVVLFRMANSQPV